MRSVEEIVRTLRDRVMHRENVDMRGQVQDWLTVAADPKQSDGARYAALQAGVIPVLQLAREVESYHNQDKNKYAAKADCTDANKEFAAKAARSCAFYAAHCPGSYETMDALLTIAEDVESTSETVRIAAFESYRQARQIFPEAGSRFNEEMERFVKLAHGFVQTASAGVPSSRLN